MPVEYEPLTDGLRSVDMVISLWDSTTSGIAFGLASLGPETQMQFYRESRGFFPKNGNIAGLNPFSITYTANIE